MLKPSPSWFTRLSQTHFARLSSHRFIFRCVLFRFTSSVLATQRFASCHHKALPNAFELFGADLLVSHTEPTQNSKSSPFTVSILELNAEPAIELTGARLSWILESMFSGICHACITPFFQKNAGGEACNEEVGNSKWEVGDVRHGLYKCLSVQVRGDRGW